MCGTAADSLDLFRKLTGLAVTLDAQGAGDDKRILRFWFVKHALVPKRLRSELRKGATAQTDEIFGFCRLIVHGIPFLL
jgi:hypothetical protein